MALGSPSWFPTPLQRDVPYFIVREHGNTSSSPRASVISIPEFTFLVIAIGLEVLIPCLSLVLYLYLVLSCLALVVVGALS